MKLKSALQKIRINIGKFFLDKKPQKGDSEVNKILFLRQDGKIGDYIVSSFVFREIKLLDPTIEIGVVCTQKDSYLFEQNKYIDYLYFVRKRNVLDYIKCGLSLAKEKYDVVIDPTIVIKNRDLLLLRLINAKHYVGYKKSHYKIFDNNIEGEYHFSQLYKIALNKMGFNIENTTYDVPFNEKSSKSIKNYLEKNNIRDFIAINFYGAAKAKKVNNENISRYLDYLTKITQGKTLVLLNYPEVYSTLKELALPYKNIFVHETKTIFDTIELIRHCSQLISTDTSTVHIASGFNKPMIALYREDPIALTHWKPMSKGDTYILQYKENINELSPEQIKKEWII